MATNQDVEWPSLFKKLINMSKDWFYEFYILLHKDDMKHIYEKKMCSKAVYKIIHLCLDRES
jgi:hypothetical protein